MYVYMVYVCIINIEGLKENKIYFLFKTAPSSYSIGTLVIIVQITNSYLNYTPYFYKIRQISTYLDIR